MNKHEESSHNVEGRPKDWTSNFIEIALAVLIIVGVVNIVDGKSFIFSQDKTFPVVYTYNDNDLQKGPKELVRGDMGWNDAIFVLSKEPVNIDEKEANTFILEKAESLYSGYSTYQRNGKQILRLSLMNELFKEHQEEPIMIVYLDITTILNKDEKTEIEGSGIVATFNRESQEATYWSISGKLYLSFKREKVIEEARENDESITHFEYDPGTEKGAHNGDFAVYGKAEPIFYDDYVELISTVIDIHKVVELNDKGVVPEQREALGDSDTASHNIRAYATYGYDGYTSFGWIYRLDPKRLASKRPDLTKYEWLIDSKSPGLSGFYVIDQAIYRGSD